MKSLLRIYNEVKHKYQKGSASPKLGYMTVQILIDREDFNVPFVFVKDRTKIYRITQIKNNNVYIQDNNGNEKILTDTTGKVFLV